MFESLHKLTTLGLVELAAICRSNPSGFPPTHFFHQLAGPILGDELRQDLLSIVGNGWNVPQVAEIATAIARSRQRAGRVDDVLDVVISGPEVVGIPTRDTGAVVHALIEEATSEVTLIGYAVHNAHRIFEPLARRMAADPQLSVTFYLDIRRPTNDTSTATEILDRFAGEFSRRHWPWSPKPHVFCDPRSLMPHGIERSSLHAKCVIADRAAALITSANFTDAAQERNIECGVIVRHPPMVDRIASYFRSLRETQFFVACELPD